MSWESEPTFAVPESLLVQLFEVGAGEHLSMALMASISVDTNGKADLSELVKKKPVESLCNNRVSCANALGTLAQIVGILSGQPGVAKHAGKVGQSTIACIVRCTL